LDGLTGGPFGEVVDCADGKDVPCPLIGPDSDVSGIGHAFVDGEPFVTTTNGSST
jgi:hypothetical protein